MGMCECISFILDRKEWISRHPHQPNNLPSCMLVGISTEIDCTPSKIGTKGSIISSQRSYTSVVSDEMKNSSLKKGKTVNQ